MGTLRNSVLLWRRFLLTFLLFIFTISFTWAQQKTITGKVTSETEGALAGVNVVVQGTTTGTMTDLNGDYTIVAPGPQSNLVFTYIGYATQYITVGAQTKIDVVLIPSISALGEIVVTGYSQQRK